MKVFLGTYPGDADSTERTLNWCAELGQQQDAELVLITEGDMTNRWNTRGFAAQAETLTYPPLPKPGPRAWEALMLQHQLFRAAYPDTPYFSLENDSIPLTRHWLAEIIEAHGPDLVTTMSGNWTQGEAPLPFLNSVAMYPANYRILPRPAAACGTDRTNNCHFHPELRFIENPRMVHVWGVNEVVDGLKLNSEGAPTFPAREDFEFLKRTWPHASLFHRNKDGTLIDRVRESLAL